MRRRAQRALVAGLGAAFILPGCLDLGGSWDPTAATSATTTASSSSTSTTTTTAGTTGTTGTMGVETETEGCSFLGCLDIPQGPRYPLDCDLWEQGCPEGQKCVPYANDGGSSWNATRCVPIVRDPDLPGEPCDVFGDYVDGLDSCDATSVCYGGICVVQCTGSPSDPHCAWGFNCNIDGSGVTQLCLPWCDPLAQDCPGDDLCLPYEGDFICVLDASGEMGAYGDPCEYANACDPGLLCLNPEYVPKCEAGGCCSPFCDTSKPNTCPGDGQECLLWYEEGMAPPGYETVGVCGVPQP